MQPISQRAFQALQEMFRQASGIHLSAAKRTLVESRLRARVEALSLESFDDYCELLKRDAGAERQKAIDLLTTNETYFFREPEHFHQLRGLIDGRFHGKHVRIWSAACSTGEEPYSIAMTLLDCRPDRNWELRASDLATHVLERARLGIYLLQRTESIPPGYLKRFASRGVGEYEGKFRVSEQLRSCVHFFQHNLLHEVATLGTFEIIFLRNVLIYFDAPTRQQILSSLVRRLAPTGLLFIGHAESLQGLKLPLRRVHRAVYEKEK